jgi:glycosyltransferase involved in cell wall biosynthesis
MTMNKKVMLIIPEMTVGGAQRSLAKLSVELASHADVFLVVFNKTGEIAYPVGGKIFSLDVFPGGTIMAKGIALRKRVERLRLLKKENNIDVAISFLEGADYVNVLSKGKEKVVLSIRGSKVHDENMQKYFYWLRSSVLIPWLYKKADLIVAVNKGIASELKRYHKLQEHKIVTIGNFYDSDAIVALSKEAREPDIEALYNDRKILVTSGRLAAEKGIAGVINMFAELRKARQDVRLVMIGDGPEKESLKKLAGEKGLRVYETNSSIDSPDIVLLGNQKNVFKYLRGATLYLMNSSSEGFPNGLVEAMICRVPVMSSDCPYGPAEILAPDQIPGSNQDQAIIAAYGVLLPIISGNQQAAIWVNTISGILDNRNQLGDLAKAAFNRAHDFGRDTVIKQWVNIISI